MSTLSHFSCPAVHTIVVGTFNSVFLYLLSFNPTTASLTITQKVSAQGPHQYLLTNERRDLLYATTWAANPSLSAWSLPRRGHQGIHPINSVPITATSSYLALSPDQSLLYSTGGPTGELHELESQTGAIGRKIQEILFVPAHELATTDKTRVALRYGSHGIDLSPPSKQAFVPHLGSNSIIIYSFKDDGKLEYTAEHPCFGDGHDGPRHVLPSADGRFLYAVTEHTSFVDVYTISLASLVHLQRVSIIPSSLNNIRKFFRGDTLRFSRDHQRLYATTRGMTSATRGWIALWSVDEITGLLEERGGKILDRFETRNSGGKANAIDIYPFVRAWEGKREEDWIVLTDDEEGWVTILSWNGNRIEETASVQLGSESDSEGIVGASHAIWLS